MKLNTPLINQHGNQGVGDKDTTLINESALYKSAFRSNKPSADAFTNWDRSDTRIMTRTQNTIPPCDSYLSLMRV
jgi:hypothetical protein